MNEYFLLFCITLTWGINGLYIKSQIIQAKNSYKNKKNGLWIFTNIIVSPLTLWIKIFYINVFAWIIKIVLSIISFIIVIILHSFIHGTWKSWLEEYIWKRIIGSLPMKLWFETGFIWYYLVLFFSVSPY